MTTADCSTGRLRSDAVWRSLVAASVLVLCLALRPHAAGAQTVEGWLTIAAIGVVEMPVVLMPIVRGEWAEDRIGGSEVGLLDGIGRHPHDVYGMVIAGHVTLEGGRPGPFYRLHRLRRGDRIALVMARQVFIYRVEGLERVRPSDVRAVYVRDGRALTLFTCIEWNARRRAYARRLIVRATLVQSRSMAAGACAHHSRGRDHSSGASEDAAECRARVADAEITDKDKAAPAAG